jgi:hypothetical protein
LVAVVPSGMTLVEPSPSAGADEAVRLPPVDQAAPGPAASAPEDDTPPEYLFTATP